MHDTVIERLSVNKLEKRSKQKARLARTEEGSRSVTSLESSSSSVLSLTNDEAARMENASSVELAKISEVNEAKER